MHAPNLPPPCPPCRKKASSPTMDTHVHAEFLRMRGTYGLTGGKAVSYTAKSSMAYQVISELNQPCPDSDTGTREGYSSEVSERGNLKRVREAAEETPYPEEALARGKPPGRKASGSQKKTETPPQTPEPRALPLHVAVRHGLSEMVRLLLEHGAPVNRRDAESNTAMDVAVSCRQAECRRLLSEAGGVAFPVASVACMEHPRAYFLQLLGTPELHRVLLCLRIRQPPARAHSAADGLAGVAGMAALQCGGDR